MAIIDAMELKRDDGKICLVYMMFVNDDAATFGEVVMQLQKIWIEILGIEGVSLVNIDINHRFRITVGVFGDVDKIHDIFTRCTIGLRTTFFQKKIQRLRQREQRKL